MSLVACHRAQSSAISFSTFALIGIIYENVEGSFMEWMRVGFEVGLNDIQISASPLGCVALGEVT